MGNGLKFNLHRSTGSRHFGPRSRRGTSQQMSPGCGVVFGLLFVIPGLLIIYFLSVRPLLKVRDAKNWERAPAVVLSSSVQTHRGSDSTTYSIQIEYEYELEGRTRRSDRYNFVGGSSSGYDSKKRVVDQYPAGHRFEAYVNPRNPGEAVIDPGFNWFFAAMFAFGAVFALAGTAVAVSSLRGGASRRSPAGRGAGSDPNLPAPQEHDGRGNILLKPETGPWAKVAGMLFITLFWNGIVSVFLLQAVNGWRSGNGEWFLTLFLIPFVLVGLGFLLGFFYALLAAFNPRVLLLLSPGSPRPGDTFSLDWEFLGSTNRLRNFTIVLEGAELATYRRGTNSYTDENVFFRRTLAVKDDRLSMGADTVRVTLPPDLMHTLSAVNNKIIWRLKVHGTIDFWPDLSMSYPLVVLPQTRRSA